jgi:subtilisin family serine protease
MRLAVLAALVLGLAVPGEPGSPSSPPGGAAPRAVVGPGLAEAVAERGTANVIVAFHAAPGRVRGRIADRLRARAGFTPTAVWETVSGMAGVVTRDGLARLAADPLVTAIDLDRGGSGGDAESLALIRAAAAHQAGVVGSGVTVAVLDTGIDRAHPDLADAIAGEHCFVPPSGCPNGTAEQDGPGSAQDDHGHGTNVTGIVTANGTAAPVGVAPEARIVAVKVLDSANRFAGSAQVLSGLDWIAAARPDVRVVNLSLGTDQLFSGTCDDATATTRAYASAVAALRARGVTVVAAAMNAGSPFSMAVPACIGGVLAVGAVYDSAFGPFATPVCSDAATAADQIACFSNSSPALDLLAPGARILSSRLGGGVSEFAGTSQAAPHVSGAAALVLQVSPALGPDGVESVLEASGTPLRDDRNGVVTPRLDVAAALGRLGGGPPPPPPPPPALTEVRVTPARLAFGRVRVGRSRALTVRVANVGTAPLTLGRARARNPFAIVPFAAATIPAGSARRLTVTFRPKRAGGFRATLTLSTNDPDAPTIALPLSGIGVRR